MFIQKLSRGQFRSFSGAVINKGLYRDFLNKITVPEITSAQLSEILSKDSIYGPPANFHLLDIR
jgi:hypothetical protein